MAGGPRYSAGSIFLQVVPVFANVQRAIEDEAKNIDRALSDQMEKSGEKAGAKAGKAAAKAMEKEIGEGTRKLSGEFEREFHKNVDSINKALAGINTNKLGNDMRREVASLKKELATLKDVDIAAEADFKRVYSELAVLEGRLRGVRDDAKIVFRADIDNALKGFAKIQAAKDSIEDPVEIEVSADFKVAERQMTAFEKSFKKSAERAASHLSGATNKELIKVKKELDALGDLRIGVDISANRAMAELRALEARLNRVGSHNPDIDVRVDTARARSELAALDMALRKVDGSARRTGGMLRRLRGDGTDAANTFRSFNIIMLAVAGAGPALIPVLAGIAGGLLAIGPAAAVAVAGLGAVAVGFSGLGGALDALKSKQEQQATNAQTAANRNRSAASSIANAVDGVADAERNAGRAAEDAAQRVADARESAADAVESALERQKDAQEAYRDSVEDVREAEQALREARRAAADDGKDLQHQIAENKLALDQALLDSFHATVDYNALQADGSATNAEQEQARITMEQARLNLTELRTEAADLAKEKKRWDRDGVNGTEDVRAAQDNLNDALESQRDAYQGLRDAAQEVDQARADGAEMVRRAIEDQNETLADNARAIADAKAALADARDSAVESQKQITSQQQAVNNAFDKLGPAGQKFVRFIWSLRDGFYAFRDAVQQAMLPAIQQAIEGFIASTNAGKAERALINMARAFGDFAKALSTSLQGAAWGGFFEMLARLGPKISDAYGGAFISFMEAFASIMTTAAPFALRFAEGLQRMADAFAKWAASKDGQKAIEGFIAYVEQVGPKVLEFFGALFDAMLNLMVALAPYGEVILNLITSFLDFIGAMDPAILGAFVTAIVVLITASQIAYSVMMGLVAGGALLGSTLSLVVFAVIAVIGALIYLYATNETARKIIGKAWGYIKKAAKVLWQGIKFYFGLVVKYWRMVWKGIQWAWKNIWKPIFNAIGAVVRWVWNKVIKPVFGFIWGLVKKVFSGIKWYWKNILSPVWDMWSKVIGKLWDKVLKPILGWIGDKFAWLGDKIKKVYNDYIAPPLNKLKDKLLPKLKSAFETTVGFIKEAWDKLKKIIGTPIKFVIEKVINGGVIAGFNKVAKFVGSKEMTPLPVPDWGFARGGVLPGYTPGKDVHHFTSPTGGRLHLSGGEAIMRPEWTAAMGPGYVERMNRLAARGGVDAIRKAAAYATGGIFGNQAFARGGVVWPVPGRNISTYGGHDGVDINRGSGWDDYGDPIRAYTSGRVTYVGTGRGYGYATFIDGHSGPEVVYGHMSGATISAGQTVKAGQLIGFVGNTGNSSAPHLHFGIPNGTYDQAVALLGGAQIADSDGGGSSWWSKLAGWVKGFFKAPAEWFKERVSGVFDSLTENFGNNPLVDMVGGLGRKALDGVIEFVRGLVGDTKEKHENDIPAGSGVNRFTGVVEQALRMLGQPLHLVDEVLHRMNQESGGNPRAVNNWDINAANGTPSVGLMQVIGPTFRAYAGRFANVGPFKNGVSIDPLANVFAGLNYALSRYGNIAGPMMQDGGYADGGILPGGNEASYSTGGIADNGTMMYDNGGYLPPGLTTVVNLTGRPEPVFTSKQWDEMSGVGGGAGTIHYEPHFEGSNLTSEDVAGDLNFTFHRMRRAGRYKEVTR